MSTIDEIREQSKTVWAVNPLTATKKEAGTEDEFSALLEQMKTGAPAGTGSRDSSDTQTRTVTEVLSDGSVLITVWEGTKIVSQTRTHAEHPQENPTVLSTRTDVSGTSTNGQDDPMAQLAASATGGASAAALALNALVQR